MSDAIAKAVVFIIGGVFEKRYVAGDEGVPKFVFGKIQQRTNFGVKRYLMKRARCNESFETDAAHQSHENGFQAIIGMVPQQQNLRTMKAHHFFEKRVTQGSQFRFGR